MPEAEPSNESESSADETPLVAPDLALKRKDALKQDLAKVKTRRPVYRQKRTAFGGVGLIVLVLTLVARLETHSQQIQKHRSDAYLECIAYEETQLSTPPLPGSDQFGGNTDPMTGLPSTPVDPVVQAAADCSKYAH
jgi:hypothetical protein